MAKNQLSYALGLDTQGYQQGLNEATRSSQKFGNELNDMSSKFVNIEKEFTKTRALALTLRQAWEDMSDAQRNSVQGQIIARNMQQVEDRAVSLRNKMYYLNKELRVAGSRTLNYDAARQGIQMMGQGVSALASAYATLTGKAEDARRAMTIFTTVQSSIYAFSALGRVLDKSSHVYVAIKRAQDALRASTIATTNATKGATVAQLALNAACSVNPYVLLATAILGIATALGIYIYNSNKAREEEEKRKKALEELKNAQESYANNVASEYGKMIGSYRMLQEQWKQLRTEQQKNQFLKDNQKEFEKLTNKVKDVASAEKFLVTDTKDVVRSFQLRAEAAANAAAAIESYSNAIKAQEMLNQSSSWVGRTIELDEWNKLPKTVQEQLLRTKVVIQKFRTEVDDRNYIGRGNQVQYKSVLSGVEITGELNPAQIATLRAAGITIKELEDNYKNATAAAERFTKAQVKLLNKANALNTVGGAKDKGTTSRTTKEEKELTVLETLQKVVKDYETQLGNINLDDQTANYKIAELQNRWEEAKKAVEDYKKAVGLELPKTRYQELEEKVKTTQKKIEASAPDVDLTPLKKQLKQEQKELYEEAVRIGKETPKTLLDTLNEELAELQLQLELTAADVDTTKLKEAIRKQLEKIEAEKQRISVEVEPAVGSVDYISKRVSDQREKLQKIPVEIDGAINPEFQEALALLNEYEKEELRIKLIMEGDKKVTDTLQGITDMAKSTADLIGSVGQLASDEQTKAELMIMQAIANVALSFTEGLKKESKWGIWNWIAAAIAGAATMTSTIASIRSSTKGYATGGLLTNNITNHTITTNRAFSNSKSNVANGIINSTSKIGDKNLIRVNGDEMILNKQQQKNVYNSYTHSNNSSITSTDQRVLWSMINSNTKKFASGGLVNSNTNIITRMGGSSSFLKEIQSNSFNNSIDTSKTDAIDITLHGETKLRGSDLDIMWKNFNTKTNKSR